MNIDDPVEKLRKIIEAISDPLKDSVTHGYLDLPSLHEIVIAESPKAYLTKEVDKENKEGFFTNFKRICERLSTCINEINANFGYSRTLASCIVENAHQQLFFAAHFPKLTNIEGGGAELSNLLNTMVLNTIQSEGTDGR
jgi:hypothetical protein